MANPYSPSIPKRLRDAVMKEDFCRYCRATWPSVVDHAIPVVQGGATVLANLAPACRRCNAHKSGRTPAQWKAARLAGGLSWPQPNPQWAMPYLLRHMDSTDISDILAALDARYPAMVEAAAQFHDRHHAERPRGADQDRDELLKIARQYRAEIDV